MEQDVLQRSFGGAAMTVAEATLIADAALEATVRTVLDALLASEILKSTRGAHLFSPCLHFRRSICSAQWSMAAVSASCSCSNTSCLVLCEHENTMMCIVCLQSHETRWS